MEFSVNYSPTLAGLVRDGRLQLDRFKCPAWPDLLAEARKTLPVYIHFALMVGGGWGNAFDSETKQLADLDRVADLLAMTGTPLVNTHFAADTKRYAHIPPDSRDPRHIREVIDTTRRDLEPLLNRFGPAQVTVENLINELGWLNLVALPETLHTLLEETGCGLLFDLSHARLAARNLGLAERDYVAALPLQRMREMHITGLQCLEGELLELVRAAGDPYNMEKIFAGRSVDHVAMTDADWPELAWAMAQIHSGQWGQPWVVSYEFGGVGPFWEDLSREDVYLEQLPRMAALVHP